MSIFESSNLRFRCCYLLSVLFAFSLSELSSYSSPPVDTPSVFSPPNVLLIFENRYLLSSSSTLLCIGNEYLRERCRSSSRKCEEKSTNNSPDIEVSCRGANTIEAKHIRVHAIVFETKCKYLVVLSTSRHFQWGHTLFHSSLFFFYCNWIVSKISPSVRHHELSMVRLTNKRKTPVNDSFRRKRWQVEASDSVISEVNSIFRKRIWCDEIDCDN
jgi:hypothetical protein